MRSLGSVARCLLAFGFVLAAAPGAHAQSVQTHQSYVESLMEGADLDIKNKKAVFAYVFKALPERVKVYPSENYYYFRFNHQGLTYAGNLRLENDLRDQGKIHFAYTADFSYWVPAGETEHVLLEGKDGIALERIDPLTYKLTYEGKSVTFELFDLSKIKVPPAIVGPDEKVIGPMFDESAVRFFLVYNSKLKQFLYVLDETGPATETLLSSQVSDRLLLGQRTGFAFYRDHKLDRRILVGVFSGNVQVNNYFDGPFDQLPDNILEGDVLRDAILEVDPSLKGKIDRFGSSFNGETRFMIAPYLQYQDEKELGMFHRCATSKKVKPELYYACFAVSEDPDRAVTTKAEERKASPPKAKRR
jgi:hypothetical protein